MAERLRLLILVRVGLKSTLRGEACCVCLTVAEKRRFIKREAASDAGDVDAEPASKITDQQQQQAVTAADTVLSVTATSSLLNGHTTVDHQPSEETTALHVNLHHTF